MLSCLSLTSVKQKLLVILPEKTKINSQKKVVFFLFVWVFSSFVRLIGLKAGQQ